ncbi:PspE protein [gamma proteobacterium HTCC5015]|nr:PspE protein [gamma proteobacterium HTCC5015]
MSYTKISAVEFAQRYKKGMTLVDVRSPAEYGGQHVDGAQNVPLDQLNPQDFCQAYVDGDQDDIYLICQKGGRAAKAADAIRQHTQANLYVVEGGTPDSIAAGAPLASNGRDVMSLERQVRIAAGSLVVLGCVLGAAVAPGFFALSAFVGAGLVFAGVTDTCAMGMLIAKMPWNQRA